MLKELRIKNLAIIDDLSLRFGKGLNVLTGETGAGKSIIVDALGLALGNRAQADLIKSGEKEATVQAFFESDELDCFPVLGIDTSEGLFLRRTISSGGKSRAYINDTMVTLQTLAETGRTLVDIHSQHEHQSLLTPERQRMFIDSFGRLDTELGQVRSSFEEVRSLRYERDMLGEKARERTHRIDLLSFQVREIDAAGLVPSKDEGLEEERKILANLSRLKEMTEASYALLYGGDGACSERLRQSISNLGEMSAIDGGLNEPFQMLESALPLIEDAAYALRGYCDRYELEPGRLEEIEDRLELLRKLRRKYGDGIADVLRYRDQAEEEMTALETSDERLAGIQAELALKEQALVKAALVLSEKRREVAGRLERQIEGTLAELAMEKIRFGIGITPDMGEEGHYKGNKNGFDRIEFLFSANTGEALKPLAKIASGGELSRVMLALKSILSDLDSIPVLIFDEVDAGIGGRTAESVAQKLVALSKKRQVLCITHLPQIARCGDLHLKIEKREKKQQVHVEVKEMQGQERRNEIARMLSGKITDISLQHAEELLGGA